MEATEHSQRGASKQVVGRSCVRPSYLRRRTLRATPSPVKPTPPLSPPFPSLSSLLPAGQPSSAHGGDGDTCREGAEEPAMDGLGGRQQCNALEGK